MRKIEQQMCQAIQNNKNWAGSNTSVITEDNVSKVYLHGNHIATVDDDTMTIFDGGWQSNTTKSRLNALCDEFCVAGEGVFQKDFAWYVRLFVGAVNGQKVFKTVDFENGFTFSWALRLFFIMNNTMNKEQLDNIKRAYAEMLVEGMDMKLLIEFAEDSIMENIKDYEVADLQEEIEDCYGEEVWEDLTRT